MQESAGSTSGSRHCSARSATGQERRTVDVNKLCRLNPLNSVLLCARHAHAARTPGTRIDDKNLRHRDARRCRDQKEPGRKSKSIAVLPIVTTKPHCLTPTHRSRMTARRETESFHRSHSRVQWRVASLFPDKCPGNIYGKSPCKKRYASISTLIQEQSHEFAKSVCFTRDLGASWSRGIDIVVHEHDHDCECDWIGEVFSQSSECLSASCVSIS